MKLEDEIKIKNENQNENPGPTTGPESINAGLEEDGEEQDEELEQTLDKPERPLPDGLRYAIFGVLVVAVVGVVAFGYIAQNSVKPPTQIGTGADCKDPVNENRIQETLKQNPNDINTLLDWGFYNLDCEKNYPAAIAAYKVAVQLSDQAAATSAQDERAKNRLLAHSRLGLAYLYNRNIKEAQEQFAFVAEQNPDDTSALFALAISYEKDDPAKYTSILQKIVEIEPNGEPARRAQELLNSQKGPSGTPTVKP